MPASDDRFTRFNSATLTGSSASRFSSAKTSFSASWNRTEEFLDLGHCLVGIEAAAHHESSVVRVIPAVVMALDDLVGSGADVFAFADHGMPVGRGLAKEQRHDGFLLDVPRLVLI